MHPGQDIKYLDWYFLDDVDVHMWTCSMFQLGFITLSNFFLHEDIGAALSDRKKSKWDRMLKSERKHNWHR